MFIIGMRYEIYVNLICALVISCCHLDARSHCITVSCMFHLASVDVNAKTSKKPAVVPPIGSVGSVPAASSGGRRRRRKRVVAACPRVVLSNNPGGAETKEPFTLSGDSQVTSVSDLKSVRTQVSLTLFAVTWLCSKRSSSCCLDVDVRSFNSDTADHFSI